MSEKKKSSSRRPAASRRLKKLWATKAWRDKIGKAVSEKVKKHWDDPKWRAAQQERYRKGWTPARRAAFSAKLKERWSKPGAREKRSQEMSNMWADPNHRARVLTPEYAAKQRERMLTRHKDPAYKKALKKGWDKFRADPKKMAEFRANAAARLRKQGAGRYIFTDRLNRTWWFRSGDQHELGCAKILDERRLTWFYEPCVLMLDSGESYLPDFWVHEWETYIEIKGHDLRLDKVEQARKAGHKILVIHALSELP